MSKNHHHKAPSITSEEWYELECSAPEIAGQWLPTPVRANTAGLIVAVMGEMVKRFPGHRYRAVRKVLTVEIMEGE